MPGIGYAITQVGTFRNTPFYISTDEGVGGLLFDTSGFDDPFLRYPLLNNCFGSGQVQLVNNMEDAASFGIDDNGFMNGLVHYHLSMFYDYVGKDAPLYVVITDCSSGWDVIGRMQRSVGGKMFQLGVWTAQRLWKDNGDGTIGFSSLVTDIESAVEDVSGKVGQQSVSSSPLNVVLSANTCDADGSDLTLKNIPNALSVDAPKVSVLLCQDGSDDIHAIQSANPFHSPVGSVGFALAILNLAGAEECIGAVASYNLNKNEHFLNPEIPVGSAYNMLEDINAIRREMVAAKGYIIPVTYRGKESACFYNSDTTLSTGDYGSIANNRVIHKCRRAVYSVLLPMIDSNQLYDNALGGLSNVAVQTLEESIGGALSGKLINKAGKYQIGGYKLEVIESGNILKDNTVSIKYYVNPVNYNEVLSESVIAR